MAEEKEKTKKKEMEKKTTKRKYERKTPIPKQVDDGERIPLEELKETPVPTPRDIERAKPEKLDVITIDEGIEKAKAEKEKLGMITTGDLPTKPKIKANKSHDPGEDIMITTADFKPRKFKDSKKL